MKYNFDEVVNRRGTNCAKWDVLAEDEIPMWVADMDFKAAPEIMEALQERLSHGVFGYSIVPEEWYEAYMNWWQRHHGMTLEKDWLLFSAGVIPTISSTIRRLTSPGDKVLIQAPVYNCFYRVTETNGRQPLESPLVYDGTSYEIDWEDLETGMRNPDCSLMLLCNPHNPIGRAWDKETLARIGDLAVANNVVVLSDEIHCDIATPGHAYVPFASVNETCKWNSITTMAPTKCFNLAGLNTSAVSIPDPVLRHKVERALSIDEVGSPNAFSVPAAVSAFEKGENWLDEFNAYIAENKVFTEAYLKEHIPEISAVHGDYTYLMWLDCVNVTDDSNDLSAYLRKEAGVFLTSGSEYGTVGNGFLRFNVACPHSQLEAALKRLDQGIHSYLN